MQKRIAVDRVDSTLVYNHLFFFKTRTFHIVDINQPKPIEKKNSSPQCACFEYGDALAHEIFVVFHPNQGGGNRYFGSFTNIDTFWLYYSTFPETRCFNWINRSKELPAEKTILYLDVEWWQDEADDVAAEHKLETVQTAIRAVVGKDATIDIERNLSRPDIQKKKYKHSYHLYVPGIYFEHNAVGCMDEVFQRIQAKCDLWYLKETKRTHILDAGVYTLNRAFRIPGSVKWDSRNCPLPLPSKDFFERTRLCGYRHVNTVHYPALNSPTTTNKRKRSSITTTPKHAATADDDPIRAHIQRLLVEKGDPYTQVHPKHMTGLTNKTHGRKCLLNPNLTHRSNTCWFQIDNDKKMIEYRCFSRRHPPNEYIHLGPLPPHPLPIFDSICHTNLGLDMLTRLTTRETHI